MLKALFVWLDGRPGSYWLVAGFATLLLATRVWTAVRENPPPGTVCAWRSLAIDALVLFLFVLGWRWPFLFAANDFNPDESQLIAGAITLAHDPVFWRSVDGTTSGPLNFYVLLPFHWLGLPLDYFTARLAALLMIGLALFACQRALTRAFGRAVGWIGVLPAAGFFATVTQLDLVHYSSEHVTLMLVALSIWLLTDRQPTERLRLWLACGFAGAAPWAKLQAAPIAVALILWALWQEKGGADESFAVRWRRLGSVVLAAATPTIVATILIAATGQLETALRRYFFQNIFYVKIPRPLLNALEQMQGLAFVDGRVPWLLGVAGTIIVFTGGYYALRRRRPPEMFLAAGMITAAAILAVMIPRREYLHYCLLLPIPLTAWLGAGLGGWWADIRSPRARLLFGSTLFFVTLLPFLATRCSQPRPGMIGQLFNHWQHPRTGAALIIRAIAPPGDCLAIWGWANNLYVETGLRQATRNTHSEWSINPNAQRDYHREEFLDQVRQNQPAAFVDAVGTGAFAFENRARQAHEIFPDLKDYVARHYTLVADLGGSRIYGRNDLAALPQLTADSIDELLSRGRVASHRHIAQPRAPSLTNWPRRVIADREVLMLLPPAELSWLLDPDVRELELEFGFDPAAYERGHSNGAEIIVELSDGGPARPVFRRLLDPARLVTDRGPQKATITLPPYGPETRLVLRSTPGENNDAAWDWLYVAPVKFRHHPGFLPAQFPQFTRVPDFADIEHAVLYRRGDKTLVSLQPSSSIGYALTGGERRLRFDYGFEDGAYANGNNTDGAVFRVEREHKGQPAKVLFERFLRPQFNSGDRGRQHADVDLAGSTPGDRLVLYIDPGPANNAAWDWTYLERVELIGP